MRGYTLHNSFANPVEEVGSLLMTDNTWTYKVQLKKCASQEVNHGNLLRRRGILPVWVLVLCLGRQRTESSAAILPS